MAIKARTDDSWDKDTANMSKKISWVLRRGAKSLGIEIDAKGWVKIADLAKYSELEDVDVATLKEVITRSNAEKARYEVSKDGSKVRAYEKEERKGLISQPYTPYQTTASATDALAAQWANPYGWPGMYPQMMSPFMNPFMGFGMPPSPAAMAMAAGRYQGRIKSFNADKGFGFIECPEAYAVYNRDVFLHRAQIGDLEVGSWVTFVCEPNKQNMPQAKDVHGFGTQQAGGKGKGGAKGKGKGKGKDKGQKGQGKREGKAAKPTTDGDAVEEKEAAQGTEDKKDEAAGAQVS